MNWLIWCVLAPAPATATSADPPAMPDAAAEEPYDAHAAARDVEALLSGNGREYTDARARLMAAPALAAEALQDRLTIVPAPGPAERKRLLDVLAHLGRPENLPLFASELRRAVARVDGAAAMDAAHPWRQLILLQGAEAMPTLIGLVGDKDLPSDVRAIILDDLVTVTPSSQVPTLVAMVGSGDRKLQRALRQSLRNRARTGPEITNGLIQATDRAIDDAPAERLPALIALRALLSVGNDDPELAARMAAVAQRADAGFPTRVSALEVLARSKSSTAKEALFRIARQTMASDARASQPSEILGWLALSALPATDAAAIVREHRLIDSDSPRLAVLGYRHAELAGDFSWLSDSQKNPWPEVRHAALDRVAGPCPKPIVRRLGRIAGPVGAGGDEEGAVARAATVALGRCGGEEARRTLRRILEDRDGPVERRAAAGRQLVRSFGPVGVKIVAEVLAATPPADVGRRLASALRYAPAATDDLRRGLCAALDQAPEVSRAARKSLHEVYGADEDVCIR